MTTIHLKPQACVSADEFLVAFRCAAEEHSRDLVPIWRNSKSDAPYTWFMTNHVLAATARRLDLHVEFEYPYTESQVVSRRLDLGFFPNSRPHGVQDALVAIEIENKEQTLSDEIAKLGCLCARLNVLFFYSSEPARMRRILEAYSQVRTWGAATPSEFLIMWNKPYQRNPHWQPCLLSAAGMKELQLFSIL